ncbi:hypothetical protein F8M41_007333 [Gigaspora margarita]|uniref:Uncharacterized protein n=1 Tax=Gigaspora margarita TaxID=4874 RepID=A0A8H3X5W2_GIGMA|nr:hypothetical protein F8M41_007333 [Gigaspora margarita]
MNIFTNNIENYNNNYGVNVNDVNNIVMNIDDIEIDFNLVTSLTTCSTSNQSISGARIPQSRIESNIRHI